MAHDLETRSERASRIVDVQERVMQAFLALSTTNKLWREKLLDVYLALSPLHVDDFPVAARPIFSEIQVNFNKIRMIDVGYGYITSGPSECRGICLKVVKLIETVSWEAIDLLQEIDCSVEE